MYDFKDIYNNYSLKQVQRNPFREATLTRGHPLWKGHLTMFI